MRHPTRRDEVALACAIRRDMVLRRLRARARRRRRFRLLCLKTRIIGVRLTASFIPFAREIAKVVKATKRFSAVLESIRVDRYKGGE